MKTAIKIFWPFGRFRIKGQKQHNSDFQSHFSMSKISRIFLNFFSLKNIKKAKNIFMAVFMVFWPCLLTAKLSCLQKNNFGHTNVTVKVDQSESNFCFCSISQKIELEKIILGNISM